jgi:ergothioneine biosynthesis protein EgtB
MTKTQETLLNELLAARNRTVELCGPLEVEDFVPQPIVDVSPPKWHLAHSTWFFEQFLLIPYSPGYELFHPDYSYLFNSYYNNAGERVLRPNRGLMSRPPVRDILAYRQYVDAALQDYLTHHELNPDQKYLVTLGINHEQQHQELLLYDIKYILGNQPTFPKYGDQIDPKENGGKSGLINIEGGVYWIGSDETDFCFDNECSRHQVILRPFQIASDLVTNGEYLAFMEASGYNDFNLWHSDGWDFIQQEKIKAPLYWHFQNGKWYNYMLSGYQPINPDLPVQHISFYEAFAFASWKEMRLPTEFEWEAAADQLKWGQLWEWTYSSYLPYPGFRKAKGALGEYNGKFMINQMVLRGASLATPPLHSRKTYRNFFQPSSRWLFSGLRLVR